MAFDFTAYMKNVAEKLKEIRHDDNAGSKKFFRISSVGNIDEMIENFTNSGSPCIMVEDNRTGRYEDNNSDNYLDNQSYSFLIMKHGQLLDAAGREVIKNECVAMQKKIISKMKKDKQHDLKDGYPRTGLRNFNLGSVYYQTIGPIGENYYGILVMFNLLEPINKEIIYNAEDWD